MHGPTRDYGSGAEDYLDPRKQILPFAWEPHLQGSHVPISDPSTSKESFKSMWKGI